MKKILCIGDSNTYGYIPESGKRYKKEIRWSGILETLLQCEIVEEGCNNRTCFCKNPAGKYYTGAEILPELLNGNFDYIIFFLGINDLQFTYNVSLKEFRSGLENTLKIFKNDLTKIILLSPPKLNKNILNSYFSTMFDETSIEKSLHISEIYKSIAKKYSCEFVDLNKIIEVSKIDGLHLDASAHYKLAHHLAKIISDL